MYEGLDTNSSAAVLELIKGSGIHDAAFLPDSSPELREVDQILADAALFAQNTGDETHYGERSDQLAGEAGDGVGLPLHVADDREPSSAAIADEGGAGQEEGGGCRWQEGGEEADRSKGCRRCPHGLRLELELSLSLSPNGSNKGLKHHFNMFFFF